MEPFHHAVNRSPDVILMDSARRVSLLAARAFDLIVLCTLRQNRDQSGSRRQRHSLHGARLCAVTETDRNNARHPHRFPAPGQTTSCCSIGNKDQGLTRHPESALPQRLFQVQSLCGSAFKKAAASKRNQIPTSMAVFQATLSLRLARNKTSAKIRGRECS